MPIRAAFALPLVAALLILAGCQEKQPDFPDLSPVKGVVKQGDKPVSGGSIQFIQDPPKPEFLVNSEVGPDGTYSLSTVRTTDKKNAERRSGAAPGTYKVIYQPPQGDQTQAYSPPVHLPKPVTVKGGENDIPIELPPAAPKQ